MGQRSTSKMLKLKGGEENDMLSTRARRVLHSCRGRAKAAKKSFNRRLRRKLKRINY